MGLSGVEERPMSGICPQDWLLVRGLRLKQIDFWVSRTLAETLQKIIKQSRWSQKTGSHNRLNQAGAVSSMHLCTFSCSQLVWFNQLSAPSIGARGFFTGIAPQHDVADSYNIITYNIITETSISCRDLKSEQGQFQGGNGFLHNQTRESLVGHDVFYDFFMSCPNLTGMTSSLTIHTRSHQATTAAVTHHGTLRGRQGLEGRIQRSCTAPENGDGNPKGWQVWKVLFRSCVRPFFRGRVMEFQSTSQAANPNMITLMVMLLIDMMTCHQSHQLDPESDRHG